LSPHIPARENERRDFFNPFLGTVDFRARTSLEKNQRYLQQNLVYGRPIQKLGTLLFCLDYAQQGGLGVAGV
jgi:type III restriction enzyme